MNNEGCWPYPDFLDIDSKWSAARVFNILALIGGFVCLVVDTLTIFDGERGLLIFSFLPASFPG